MNESKKVSFTKLSGTEMLTKLSRLQAAKSLLNFWQKGGKVFPASIGSIDVLEGNKGKVPSRLRLHSEHIGNDFLHKEVLLHFTVGKIDYFTKGKLDEISTDKTFSILLAADFFRSEKRKEDRLIAYPQHRIYAYFALSKKSDELKADNVVQFNRPQNEEKKFFENFEKKLQLLDLPENSSGKFLCLRVIDLSSQGLAFFVSRDEKLYFDKMSEESELLLKIEEDLYRLPGAKLIYNVDYIDPRFPRVMMNKVGVKFTTSDENFLRQVRNLVQEDQERININKEFEDFSE